MKKNIVCFFIVVSVLTIIGLGIYESKATEPIVIEIFNTKAQIDSLFKVLKSQIDYTEEQFWYRMLDTLIVDQPAIGNIVRELRGAFLDSTIETWKDSVGFTAKIVRWLAQDSTTRLRKIKRYRRLGAIVYYSFDDLSAVIEQLKYQRLTKRKVAKFEFSAKLSDSETGFKFDNLTQMMNRLNLKRAQYDTSFTF